jgi:hypothetical protein
MKVIDLNYLRCKITECRISSIEEKIEKLQELYLFFQIKFDQNQSEKIYNKIEYLCKRKAELMTVFQSA